VARFGAALILGLALVWTACGPASCQELSASPPPFSLEPKKEAKDPLPTPLALALSLAFDATTWARVGVSTSAPSVEMARLLRGGFYRLELLQLVQMADGSGRALTQLTARREKGEDLAKIAADLSLDLERIYEESLVKAADVERTLQAVDRVCGPAKAR